MAVNGCDSVVSITVTESPLIAANITTTQATCNQSNGTATANPTGGTPAYTYAWSATSNQALSNTPQVTNLSAGTYTVTITDQNNCSTTGTTTIIEIATPSISTSTTPINCHGETGTITTTATGGAMPYTYSWNTTPVQTTPTANNLIAGIYTVTVTDNNNCINSETVTITEPDLLQVTVTSIINTSCNEANGSATTTTAGGVGPYTYSWVGNTAPIPAPTLPLTADITALIPGTYTLTVTDQNNCQSTTGLTIGPSTAPSALFSTTPQQGCNSVCIDLQANTVNTNSSLTYNWSFEHTDNTGNTSNHQPTGNNNNNNNPQTSICFDAPGSYHAKLTVTDNNGCTASTTQNKVAEVYPTPIASFTMTPTKTSIFDPLITFTNTSSNISSLEWSFGDEQNTSSTVTNPEFRYESSGKYCPSLKVSNSYGCVDSTTSCLEIIPEFTFYAPNSFTPDGNKTNEGWSPKGIGIDENNYELTIYDRWGELIFQTDTWGEEWDGTVNGTLVQIDTYIWKVNFKDTAENRNHNYLGRVSVVR